jgi:hypothetical protein
MWSFKRTPGTDIICKVFRVSSDGARFSPFFDQALKLLCWHGRWSDSPKDALIGTEHYNAPLRLRTNCHWAKQMGGKI